MIIDSHQQKERSKNSLKKAAHVIESDFPQLSTQLNNFVDAIEKGKIPENFPDTEAISKTLEHYDDEMNDECRAFLLPIFIKQFANCNGMYQMVTKDVAQDLAQDLKGKKVLEVMAGSGWQAKALAEQGIDVTATDDNSWELGGRDVFDVEALNGWESVRQYKDEHDVLLISWPPYEDMAVNDIIKEWGSEKPIIYMGEGVGGCCANDEFFEMLKMERMPTNYQSTRFINDDIFKGHLQPEYDPNLKPRQSPTKSKP